MWPSLKALPRGNGALSIVISFVFACALQQFLLLNSKAKNLFHQKVRAQKIAWTASYRKAHKKVCIYMVIWFGSIEAARRAQF